MRTIHAISSQKFNPIGLILNHQIQPIGYIDTPFKQKFAIPRQGNGLSSARGEINFAAHINIDQALAGIEEFSHLWLLFIFHENTAQGYKDKVRPPRLGGNKKIGVFASRSSFRPNAIGMSLVKNLGKQNKVLQVSGVDLLDKTPIVDIKPYIPYADIETSATSGYAQEKPSMNLAISYTEQANQFVQQVAQRYPDFVLLLENILSQDPRPAYKKTKQDDKLYHLSLYDIDVHWQISNNQILVYKMNQV